MAEGAMRDPLEGLRYEVAGQARRWWWVTLLAGIAWLIISLIVFRFDADSVRAVGIIAGVLFIIAGVEELALVGIVQGGWRWFHGLLGVVLIVGGIIAFARPVNTFLALAALVGWILLVKGIFDIVLALTNRDLDLWWLRLVLGILELILAIAVSGNFVDSAVFVIAFVAAWTLVKGVTDIITAFQLRTLRPDDLRPAPA
jgi:uncharacterized membrane protein HdeD (DUF308 family)